MTKPGRVVYINPCVPVCVRTESGMNYERLNAHSWAMLCVHHGCTALWRQRFVQIESATGWPVIPCNFSHFAGDGNLAGSVLGALVSL